MSEWHANSQPRNHKQQHDYDTATRFSLGLASNFGNNVNGSLGNLNS